MVVDHHVVRTEDARVEGGSLSLHAHGCRVDHDRCRGHSISRDRQVTRFPIRCETSRALRFTHTTCGDRHLRAGSAKGKHNGSGGPTRTQHHTPLTISRAALVNERTDESFAIGRIAKESAVSGEHGVDRPEPRRRRGELVAGAGSIHLVRHGDRECSDAKGANAVHRRGHLSSGDRERHEDPIETGGRERGVPDRWGS